MTASKFSRKFLFSIISIAGLAIVLPLLLEILFRGAGYKPLKYNEKWFEDYRKMHRICGQDGLIYELVPDFRGKFHIIRSGDDPRPDTEYRINSLGMRSAEPLPIEKAGRRIIVLGDSITFGFDVDADRTFTAVAQKYLNAAPAVSGSKTEILNCGVTGYNTSQEIAWLRKYGLALRPDAVIIVFSSNDIGDPISQFSPRTALKMKDLVSSDSVPDYDGFLEKIREMERLQSATSSEDDLPAPARFRLWLAERSAFVEAARLFLMERRHSKIPDEKQELSGKIGDRDCKEFKWLERQFDEFSELARKNGFKPAVIFIPSRWEIGCSGLEEKRREFSRMLESRGIAYSDLSDSFAARLPADIYLADGTHLSEKGHSAAAEALIRIVGHLWQN